MNCSLGVATAQRGRVRLRTALSSVALSNYQSAIKRAA
jgi:hypothetical protein